MRAAADDVGIVVVVVVFDVTGAAKLENDQDLVASEILGHELELDRRRLTRTDGLRTTQTRRVDRAVAVAADSSRDEANLVPARIFDPGLESDPPSGDHGAEVDRILDFDPVLGS